RPALPPEGGLPQGCPDEASEAALAQPPLHRPALGEEGEVTDVVSEFTQPADGLREVAGVRDGHGSDHHAVVPGQHEVEDLHDALPPGPQVPEVVAEGGRQHAVQTEPGLLGVADDAARETASYLVCG